MKRKLQKFLKQRGEGAVKAPFPGVYILWWGLVTPTEEELKQLRELGEVENCEVLSTPCHPAGCLCPQGDDGYPEGEGCVEDHYIILW